MKVTRNVDYLNLTLHPFNFFSIFSFLAIIINIWYTGIWYESGILSKLCSHAVVNAGHTFAAKG